MCVYLQYKIHDMPAEYACMQQTKVLRVEYICQVLNSFKGRLVGGGGNDGLLEF